MKRVVGIGAGGHAIVAIDILLFMGELDLVGLLDSDRIALLGEDTGCARLHPREWKG